MRVLNQLSNTTRYKRKHIIKSHNYETRAVIVWYFPLILGLVMSRTNIKTLVI